MSNGIQLNSENDLAINVKRKDGMITGGLVIGSRRMQDAYIILSVNQGDIKEDPIAGANLLRMIRSKLSYEKIRKTVEISLARVGIRFEDIKDQFEMIINKIVQ